MGDIEIPTNVCLKGGNPNLWFFSGTSGVVGTGMNSKSVNVSAATKMYRRLEIYPAWTRIIEQSYSTAKGGDNSLGS